MLSSSLTIFRDFAMFKLTAIAKTFQWIVVSPSMRMTCIMDRSLVRNIQISINVPPQLLLLLYFPFLLPPLPHHPTPLLPAAVPSSPNLRPPQPHHLPLPHRLRHLFPHLVPLLPRRPLSPPQPPPHAFDSPPPPSSSPSFHLNIKPFFFWKRHGSKKLAPNVLIFWDFSRAKFSSGPEPLSAFYVAVVVDGDMTLLLGDLNKEAYAKTRANQVLDQSPQPQALVLKREHVVAKNIYTTKAKLGGRIRDIQIECGHNDDFSRLSFSVDNKRVLQIKRLKWKFRGNERIEVDGVPMHISWDVYNWLFENDGNDGHAVFMFRFEEDEQDINTQLSVGNWAQQQQQFWNFGMNGIEWRKMGKSFSSSSVSMSSAGSCSSSVMEWATMEESELSAGPTGFSLLVYAWRR
ncbi:hypothetical protein ACLB2K_018305 [Fragaria x ananassa]